MVEHRNLACYLRSVPGFLMTGSGHVVPSWAPVTFDLSLIEWSYALLTGGTVLLVPDERVLDLPALVAGALSRATSLVAVPALLRQIVLHLEETGERGAWSTTATFRPAATRWAPISWKAMRRVFPRAVLRKHLRSDRDHHALHRPPGAGGGAAPWRRHRPAGGGRRPPSPRPRRQPGAARRAGRDLGRRRRRGARLLPASGAHRRALRRTRRAALL